MVTAAFDRFTELGHNILGRPFPFDDQLSILVSDLHVGTRTEAEFPPSMGSLINGLGIGLCRGTVCGGRYTWFY